MKLKPLRFFLLGLSPLACLLPPYLAGWGMISSGRAFLVSAASLFILPFIVSMAIILLGRAKGFASIVLFVATLLLQFVLLFLSVLPLAKWETMGLGHRIKRDFSLDELRNCAEQIRNRDQHGTLLLGKPKGDEASFWETVSIEIDDSELPADLRGRFR